MADFIKIQLLQGADENGEGGEVLAAPSVKLRDGTLHTILDAFKTRYGLQRTREDGSVEVLDPARNYPYRLREYTSRVVETMAHQRAQDEADAAAERALGVTLRGVEVIE